jgi:hypothetical protein
VRTEGLSTIAVAAEAAPNTSTGSIRCAFDLGLADCEDCSPRPRKSFVPRRRPFKMAGSSACGRVPVRQWLVPRAASTLLASPALVRKARPGAPVHSKRKGSGAMAHGDLGGFAFPGVKVPLVRASLVCPSSATGSSVLAEQDCYVMTASLSINPALLPESLFLNCRRRGSRQKLRLCATGGRRFRPSLAARIASAAARPAQTKGPQVTFPLSLFIALVPITGLCIPWRPQFTRSSSEERAAQDHALPPAPRRVAWPGTDSCLRGGHANS